MASTYRPISTTIAIEDSLYPPAKHASPNNPNSRRIGGAKRDLLAVFVGGIVVLFVMLHREQRGGFTLKTGESEDLTISGSWTPGESRRAQTLSLYGMGKFKDRSWLDHVLSLDTEGLAPITHFAQKWIHDNQNPPIEECANAQYYLLDIQGLNDAMHGLGSLVHIASFALLNAIETKRILMWDPEHAFGRAFVDDNCLADGIRSMDCVFSPLSHCSHTFMNDQNTIRGYKLDPPEGFPKYWTGETPTIFKKELLKELSYDMTPNSRKYWWRGQAAAYFLRLNPESLKYISKMRLDPEAHSAFTLSGSVVDDEPIKLPFPFPLPRGVQSFHIRHGDKGREMELHSLEDYVAKGEELSKLNPNAHSKSAFLSSEDPKVFEEAKKILRLDDSETFGSMDWIWYTSKINRLNGGPFSQLGFFGNRTETTLSWMAELMLTMECDAWVGQRGSNWNRVIDELRCIWTSKCAHPFVEVGPEDDWGGYNW